MIIVNSVENVIENAGPNVVENASRPALTNSIFNFNPPPTASAPTRSKYQVQRSTGKLLKVPKST